MSKVLILTTVVNCRELIERTWGSRRKKPGRPHLLMAFRVPLGARKSATSHDCRVSVDVRLVGNTVRSQGDHAVATSTLENTVGAPPDSRIAVCFLPRVPHASYPPFWSSARSESISWYAPRAIRQERSVPISALTDRRRRRWSEVVAASHCPQRFLTPIVELALSSEVAPRTQFPAGAHHVRRATDRRSGCLREHNLLSVLC